MEALSLDDLDADRAAFDGIVESSPDIDRFCSSTDWILPACAALMPARQPYVRRGAHGYAALMRGATLDGREYLEPLEAMWGLACPLIGRSPDPLARELAATLRAEEPGALLVLCGIVEGTPRFLALVSALEGRYRLRRGPVTRRFAADLRGGLDGFLARRSANLRGTLAKSRRQADAAGIWFAPASAATDAEAEALYARILEVEARSWKGREGSGLLGTEMQAFYRRMIPRLARRGGLRLLFGRDSRAGDRDVAYILGGVLGDTYRGLQFSFDDDYARMSLGNVAQFHQIARLCDEGISFYDLGSDVEYKRRWAEPGLETVTMLAYPR